MRLPTLTALVLSSFVSTWLVAEEVTFRRHVIDGEATYSACAVFDVNKDGQLDIVNGGQWFAGPDWKQHKLRDVQVIRGRYDDYSNLPVDLNGDGWLDLISANYRSQTLYWVEHPGGDNLDQTWKRHEIAMPGPMETGRLVDMNGDGRPDLLPNGVKFAAWWEWKLKDGQVDFTRHRLPDSIAGHGIGFGDVNRDGKLDLVSAHGWFAGDGKGNWEWKAEWRLPRDCSIPILVWDFDGDGDSDIAWGRGHNVGLYWLEQTRANGKRTWLRHTIDTSLACAHSLLLADVDGDGNKDLVAGKRYMGHDGRDLGELDPLAVYWYSFDKKQRIFQRHVISQGHRAGFGLDPKAVDIDGDGDVDFVGPGRSGLYLFENLRINKKGVRPSPNPGRKPDNTKPTEPLVKQSPSGPSTISNHPDWAVKRQSILAGMELAMGKLPQPAQRVPLDIRWLEHKDVEGYRRYRIDFLSEPGNRVPAYLLVPTPLLKEFDPKRPFAPSSKRAAAMLCLHQTTLIGKGEPAGLGGRDSLHYGHELAKRGYVCLVPDYPSFGDYPYDFGTEGVHYQSGSMKAIWNNVRGVDLLEGLGIVETDKIGCIGHSLGGHNSLFTAAFDQRLRAVVTSCGFTAFHHYYGGKLKGWTSDRYMPRIRQVYHNNPDEVPFDFYGVVGAIAPRAVFINAPTRDSNFELEGVKKVVAGVKPIFKLSNAKVGVVARYPESGHDFPKPIRDEAYEWLDKVFR